MPAEAEPTLRCAECERCDDSSRGWTLRLGEDDELVAFCPQCDEIEFGGAPESRP